MNPSEVRNFDAVLAEEGDRPFAYTFTAPVVRALQEIEDRDAANYEPVSPWWITMCTDHIYENCPAGRRGGARKADTTLYPDACVGRSWGDICGWCARVWRARHPGSMCGIPPEEL